MKKAHSSLQAKYWVFSQINVRLITSISLSFIRWWDNVVYSVEKSYVDILEALKVFRFKFIEKFSYIEIGPLVSDKKIFKAFNIDI